jgi:predicted nucleic acid-binding Zn ribbon protein
MTLLEEILEQEARRQRVKRLAGCFSLILLTIAVIALVVIAIKMN